MNKDYNVANSFDGPIIAIGYLGHPINRFSHKIVYQGEVLSFYYGTDNLHDSYLAAFADYKQILQEHNLLHRVDNYTKTIEQFVNDKYFENPFKRRLYKLYLWAGKIFFHRNKWVKL